MIREEEGRVVKNNITLIEYAQDSPIQGSKFFLQVGVIGLYCTQQELKDLHTVLNFYTNLEDFAQCTIKIGDENVSLS